MNRPTYCRSWSDGLHRFGEKKDCIRCQPMTGPCPPDQHDWVFTTPGHILCTQCLARGQRWISKEERVEFRAGGWFYLGRRYTKPAKRKTA